MGEETLLVRSKDKNFQKANPCLANHSKRRPQVCGAPEAVPSSGVPTSPPEKSVLPETDRTRSPDLRDLWGKLDPGDAPLVTPGIMPPARCGGNSGQPVAVLFFMSL